MDDPAAESAGANGVHVRRLQMSLTSVCFVRVAQFAAGSLLLLLAAAWGTTRAGATQEVDPPQYRPHATTVQQRSFVEPEIEIIPRRMQAPDADVRSVVRYPRVEPPHESPQRSAPAPAPAPVRIAAPERQTLRDGAAATAESEFARRNTRSTETAEKLVRPAPAGERAEPLVLHGNRRRSSTNGPAAPHGEIAVPLILGPADRVPAGSDEDAEQDFPELHEQKPATVPSDAPERLPFEIPSESPIEAPVSEKPPLVVGGDIPARSSGMMIPSQTAEVGSQPVADPGVIRSTPVPGTIAPQLPYQQPAAAGAAQQYAGPVGGMPGAQQPPQWRGSSSMETGAPVGPSGFPAAGNMGWSVPEGYSGTAPAPTAPPGWQPGMTQSVPAYPMPAYQMPMRPDSYRSVASTGMMVGGATGTSGRYGPLPGTARSTGVPTPPGSRYGSLPATAGQLQAPAPTVSRYRSAGAAVGGGGMNYGARVGVPQPMPQYAQMPQYSRMQAPHMAQSRYGAVPVSGGQGAVSAGVPRSVGYPAQGPAGSVPGGAAVSTASRTQALPSGGARSPGAATGVAPVSSSRYGAPAATGPAQPGRR